MKQLQTKLSATAVALLLAGSVSAHDMVPGAAQTQPILIQDGTVYSVANGVLSNTDLLLENGKITAIGVDLAVPDNAQVIAAEGKHIYPGLIALDTTLGLIEIEAVRATDDQREVGLIHPEVRGHIAYNPDSEVIPTLRYNGITHAQIVPQGSLIMGQSSVLELDAWTWEDGAQALDIGVHINWPRVGLNTAWWERRSPEEQRKANAEARERLEKAIADAQAYATAKAAGTLDRTDIRWEAMVGVFDGSKKLFVHADDKRQIEQAIALQQEYGFDMVIMGARDAWRMLDQLAAADIPVVYGAPFGLPSRHDEAFDQAFSVPGQLAAAGVDFAIAYPGFWDTRNLAFAAGNAAAYGLDKDHALRAITLDAARILGIDDELGSLEVGKEATLLISNGDVLDPLGQDIQHMFIEGREVDLRSRHTQLYEKYKQKPTE